MRVQGLGFRVQKENRAAPLTPAGGAAIAVVRLTGMVVAGFLRAHFDRQVPPGRCVHGTLSDGTRVLDDPVVVISGDGMTADVSLHGGPWVVRSVLELARRAGFEVVEAAQSPLHEDAVDGETELEREVAQYLPLATTELAVRALLAQRAAWERWEAEGRRAPDVASVLADRCLHWLLHPPRVAIVGVPNVGKSTLANALFARERVITADIPGTTRDWVGETANLDGLAVMLVDTPGVRETADPIEREAIERSREQVEGSDVVVLVLDPTQHREPGQALLESIYPSALRVLNKSDRGGRWKAAGHVMRTIATTGEGVDALKEAVRGRFLGKEPLEMNHPRCWTERQSTAIARASGAGSAGVTA